MSVIENIEDVRSAEIDLHEAFMDSVSIFRDSTETRQIELTQTGAGHGQEGVANDYRVGDAQDFSSFGGTHEDLEIDLASQSYSTRSLRSIPPGFTNTFRGGGHIDTVIGSSDNDKFVGDEHDNTFLPGDGIDFVYGSGKFDEELEDYPYESIDTVKYEDSYSPVIYDGDFTGIEAHASKAHHHAWGGTAQADHLFSIENFVGSDHGDVFINDYHGENNEFTGGAGSDVYALNSSGNGGNDVWTDFTSGEDRIDVTDLKFNVQLAADLTSHDDMRQALVSNGLIFAEEEIQQIIDDADANYEANGSKLILDFGDYGTLTLEGVAPGELTINDFVFVDPNYDTTISLEPGSNGKITLFDGISETIVIPNPDDDFKAVDAHGNLNSFAFAEIVNFDVEEDLIDLSNVLLESGRSITREDMENLLARRHTGFAYFNQSGKEITLDFFPSFELKIETASHRERITADNFIYDEDLKDGEKEDPSTQSGNPSHHW